MSALTPLVRAAVPAATFFPQLLTESLLAPPFRLGAKRTREPPKRMNQSAVANTHRRVAKYPHRPPDITVSNHVPCLAWVQQKPRWGIWAAIAYLKPLSTAPSALPSSPSPSCKKNQRSLLSYTRQYDLTRFSDFDGPFARQDEVTFVDFACADVGRG